MREALSALTNRGRAFLAAGAAAILCAIVLGYPALTRVGALLMLMPFVTAFFVGRGRYRLGLVRTLTPAQVTAGQQARVQLDLTNDGRLPTGLLLLEEQIPYVLGTRPRFVVNRMGPHWSADRRVRRALRRTRQVRGRPDDGAALGPVRADRARPDVRGDLVAGGHTEGHSPACDPAVGCVDRCRRQPPAGVRIRKRRGRDRTRTTARATTCVGCTGAAARRPVSSWSGARSSPGRAARRCSSTTAGSPTAARALPRRSSTRSR